MLNCTDLACVLHHHHFYAHLHHLRHHLQDDDNTEFGNGSDVDSTDGSGFIYSKEDSSASPVDTPSDVIYMVCGVLIAMLSVGLIIVLVAVTINKLRKREETSSVSPAGHHVEAQLNQNHLNHNNNNNNQQQQQQHQLTTFVTSQPSQVFSGDHQTTNNGQQFNNGSAIQNGTPIGFRQTPQSVWVFPPLPPQPNIYCINNHDALAHLNDKGGFKGFRKQFSGRFKRLIAKKSNEPIPVIPPELKPQLKTIYVY